jgi:hypothetical protein
VAKGDDEAQEAFEYRQLKQEYFIKDLKRFGIQTVLVAEYADITRLLRDIESRFKRRSVFISGAADEYVPWTPETALKFLHDLAYGLSNRSNRIITGFGLGVGGAVINGCLAYLSAVGKTVADEYIAMRPFPQVATGGKSLADQWTEYRKAMIAQSGIAVFVFGNKRDAGGKVIESPGLKQEFDLCVQVGVQPLPIGATGYVAKALWQEVVGNLAKYYPEADTDFASKLHMLGDRALSPDKLLQTVAELVVLLQKG